MSITTIKFNISDRQFLLPQLLSHGFIEEIGTNKVFHPTLDNDFSLSQFNDAYYKALKEAEEKGFGFYGKVSEDGISIEYYPFINPGS